MTAPTTNAFPDRADFDLAPGDNRSLAELLASAPEEVRREALGALSEDQARSLAYSWEFWGRPNQQEPTTDYFAWLILAGRGYGKTRTGGEWTRKKVKQARDARTPIRVALIAETAADARDVLVLGESGIMAISEPDFYPTYNPSKRRVTWPDGSQAFTFSGDEPDQLRGPQFHAAWVDEWAKYRYATETMDNLEFGLRLGDRPQMVVTTTPRPLPSIKRMIEDPLTVVTTGSSYENIANLAPGFIRRVIQKYEGTRIGRQEIHAEILSAVPGALWSLETIEITRRAPDAIPAMKRIVVAVDPAVSAEEDSDETGIVVVGRGTDDHGYVLRDRSGRYSPNEWAQEAVRLYHEYSADRIVYERNQGGDMVERVLQFADPNVPTRGVHASRGKHVRAEPVAALYEQARMHNVGTHAKLEDQMTSITPDGYQAGGSPDRLDAMVWGATEVMLRSADTNDGWSTFKR